MTNVETLTEEDLYEREYRLRKISDKDKTPKQYDEAMALKAEIRRRFALTIPPEDTERADS